MAIQLYPEEYFKKLSEGNNKEVSVGNNQPQPIFIIQQNESYDKNLMIISLTIVGVVALICITAIAVSK